MTNVMVAPAANRARSPVAHAKRVRQIGEFDWVLTALGAEEPAAEPDTLRSGGVGVGSIESEAQPARVAVSANARPSLAAARCMRPKYRWSVP